ncbi:UNVERIFIED_CONTAM: hypothetical protein PYX00_001824 [Menopon gallinae]|uniref:Uncharacterized protein n=1 Tax=Menopon gallinae TaxID=328185 RepID=A0AAW2IEJ2_9NEOP
MMMMVSKIVDVYVNPDKDLETWSRVVEMYQASINLYLPFCTCAQARWGSSSSNQMNGWKGCLRNVYSGRVASITRYKSVISSGKGRTDNRTRVTVGIESVEAAYYNIFAGDIKSKRSSMLTLLVAEVECISGLGLGPVLSEAAADLSGQHLRWHAIHVEPPDRQRSKNKGKGSRILGTQRYKFTDAAEWSADVQQPVVQ